MRRKTLLAAGAAGAVAALALASPAASGVASTSLPTVGLSGDGLLAGAIGPDAPAADRTLDTRAVDQPVAPTADQAAAVRALLAAAPDGGRATWDDRFGTPRSLGSATGYLTGPRSGSAVEVARGFLADNAAAFGLRAADIAALAVTRDHALPGTGTHVVTFQQTWNGVASVQGGRLNVAVTKDGRVLRYTGNPVRSGSLVGDWTLSASQALGKTATALAPGIAFSPQQLGSQSGYLTFAKGPFGAGSYVKKAVFPTRDGAIPAYRIFFIKNLQTAWDTVIDARTGAILYRTSAVAHDVQSGVQSGVQSSVHSDGLVQPLVDPKGLVYENFPNSPKGGDPVVRSFGATPESPAGWVDPTGIVGLGGPTTLGNNANTYANWSNYLVPADQGPRPVDPLGQFLYSYDGNWQKSKGGTVPPSYALDLNAAATNLFYQHNRIHDEYYKLGFTETAGNFQVSNNGKGGSGGDPILGLVQAGAASGGDPTYTGRDNAYMLTLDDGIPPWSGMFLWEPIADGFEGPYRDGDLDASVIQHEYTHGLSNRYVAGGSALGSQQAGSMGEGWGDWYALNHLYATGVQDKAVVGEYVTGNPARGIRNWNYDQNPTTYGDIGYDLTGPEVHADGEIWTATLWDLRKALVARYGAEKGGQVAAQLVTDGMPLSAPDPSYLDVRDGILAADLDRNHGDNAELIWKVFATRGEGASATTRGGDDTDPTPAFDSPYSADNGLLSVTVVNATTGKPVA
ncbi:MAG: M36 family metallopeptidase, partial [Actinomycetes bacterium]